MEIRKNVGHVTEEEKDQVKALFERKNGLTELAKIITSENDPLYERVVKDMGDTETKFQTWWKDMSEKYDWASAPDGHWEIDFESNEIFLVVDGR